LSGMLKLPEFEAEVYIVKVMYKSLYFCSDTDIEALGLDPSHLIGLDYISDVLLISVIVNNSLNIIFQM